MSRTSTTAAAERVEPLGQVPDATAAWNGAAQALTAADVVSLRQLTAQDLQSLDFLRQGEAAGGRPSAPAGRLWLAGIGGLNTRLGGGWAIVLSGGGAAVGLIVYTAVDARQEAAIISYALTADVRGQGIGAAAVGAAVARLLDEIGFLTLFADVELFNLPSRRLLYKIGFDPLTPGNTPGVEVAPGRPGQRWRIGRPSLTAARGLINLGAVGHL